MSTIETVNLVNNIDVDGVNQHATVNSAASSVQTILLNGVQFSSQAVVTDLTLYMIIMIVFVFVFFQFPIHGSLDFYRTCFKRRSNYGSWKNWFISKWGAPSPSVFDSIWTLIFICETIAGILYLWNFKGPVGTVESNRFTTVTCLFIILIILQKGWVSLFYNYHYKTLTLVLSCLVCLLMVFASLGLVITLGLIGGAAFQSFGLFFFIPVWFVFLLTWNCHVAHCFIWSTARCKCKNHPCQKDNRHSCEHPHQDGDTEVITKTTYFQEENVLVDIGAVEHTEKHSCDHCDNKVRHRQKRVKKL